MQKRRLHLIRYCLIEEICILYTIHETVRFEVSKSRYSALSFCSTVSFSFEGFFLLFFTHTALSFIMFSIPGVKKCNHIRR